MPRDTALRTHSIPETATVDPLVGLTAGAVTEEAQPGTVRPAPEAPISRHVAFQLAEAARHLPDRPVEITLNPEELGRVRMTLTLSDTAMTVSLLVERGETAELLRRNIEGLAQEFRALGYRDVAFEFSGEGRGSDGQAGAQTDNPVPHTPDPAKLPDEDTPAPLRIDVSGRVDIRL
ncbi:MAG: flagellar hook-length control protein FliK [Rhodobacter sp.]|nr:flagellar hook-length control protein FliK [Rhodobacter sp.]